MEASIPLIRMKIDGTEIVNLVARKYSLSFPEEIVRMGYDSEADVFYAHFVANAEAVDSEILNEDDNVILGLDHKDNIVRITILNASQFRPVEG